MSFFDFAKIRKLVRTHPKVLNHLFSLFFYMNPWLFLMIIGVFIAIISIVWYYFERTKPKRIRAIKDEKSMSPKDEAYNAIQTTKSIMKVFRRKGKKVKGPAEKVEEAEVALDSGKFSKAQNLAEEARDDLKDLAGSEGSSGVQAVQSEDDKKAYTVEDLDDLEEDTGIEESEKAKELEEQKERLRNFPENYLESKFELRVAREMMEEEEEEDNPDAEEYLEKAEEFFETEDYTKALSYSVKCKKAIDKEGAGLIKAQRVDRKADIPEEMKKKIEEMPGLSLEPKEEKEETETGVQGVQEEEKGEEVEETESEKKPSGRSLLEGKNICPDCGYEGEEDDKFCPKCGTELEKHMVCPSCGNEVSEDDQFCSKCGTKIKLESSMSKCPECGVELSVEAKFCPNCGSEL